MAAMNLRLADQFGRYRIIKRLGQGGWARSIWPKISFSNARWLSRYPTSGSTKVPTRGDGSWKRLAPPPPLTTPISAASMKRGGNEGSRT